MATSVIWYKSCHILPLACHLKWIAMEVTLNLTPRTQKKVNTSCFHMVVMITILPSRQRSSYMHGDIYIAPPGEDAHADVIFRLQQVLPPHTQGLRVKSQHR